MTSQEFRDRLRSIIREKGENNQTIFAEQIGEEQSQVSKWLSIGREPREHAVANICQALGVNLNWLFTGRGNKYLPQPGMVQEAQPPYGAPRIEFSRRGDEGEILSIWQALSAAQRKEVLNFARYQKAQAETAASKKRA